jgi:two-component system LytT family response regulator
MKVLIIEDEAAATRRLIKLLNEYDAQEIEVVETLDSVSSSVNWLSSNPHPDLILMDIQLADGNSFEIFKFVDIKKPVIFITAFDQYAVQAFKVSAIDYLLKPIKSHELVQAIEKYKKFNKQGGFNYEEIAEVMRKGTPEKRFLIRFGQQIKVVEMKEAAYFYTQDKITFIVTKEGKRYPLDVSLEHLEQMLDDSRFFRINRQFIIGIDSISEMYAYSKSRVKVLLQPPSDKETIVSTERSPHFKKWLTGE